MNRFHLSLATLLSTTLTACGGMVPPPTGQMTRPPAGPPASAFTKSGPLIGTDARQLTNMFGQPRLDIRESNMRKLQFANGRCVLDTYLYMPPQGREPLVTHADARSPTGADMDVSSCASALQGK